MSSSVYYNTTTPLSGAAVADIEAEAYAGPNTWWCEGISFHDAVDGILTGSTKLLRVEAWTADGKAVRLSHADDTLMTWRDCSTIVEMLARWSRQHGVTWELHVEDDCVGHVTPEGPDTKVIEFLRDFFDFAGVDLAPDQVAGELARILRTYPLE